MLLAHIACVAWALPQASFEEDQARRMASRREHQVQLDPVPFPLGEVLGMADLHAHQFSEDGFGGRVVVDHYPCTGEVHGLRKSFESMIGLVAPDEGEPPPEDGGGPLLPRSDQVRRLADSAVIDSLLRHETKTTVLEPAFDSWAHEQYSSAQLHQAVRGGMRLFVMNAMSNTVLCAMSKGIENPNSSCADADNIPRQIYDAWRFESDHPDWYRIALTPLDANHTMAAGRLAVVLSTEGSDLIAGRARGGLLNPRDLNAELSATGPRGDEDGVVWWMSSLGVRVFQATHEWNSWAAAAAIQHTELFQAGYSLMRRRPTPPSSVSMFDLLGPFFGFRTKVGSLASWPMPSEIAVDPVQGDYVRNADGLTPLGAALVVRARDAGMMIDVVHSSEHAVDQMRAILGWLPFILSHETVRAPTLRTRLEWEYQASDATLDDLGKRGGVFGILPSGERTMVESEAWAARLCPGSSPSFAQSLLHVGIHGATPAFGSDMNGAATMLFPRLQHERACGAQTEKKYARSYADTMKNFLAPPKQPAARRASAYEFATNGLAHVGLEPALLEDVRFIQDHGWAGVSPVPRNHRAPVWAMMLSAQRTVDVWFATEDSEHWTPASDGVDAVAAIAARPRGDLNRCVQVALGAPETLGTGCPVTKASPRPPRPEFHPGDPRVPSQPQSLEEILQ